MPGELDLWQVVAVLRQRLPEDAIVVNGAGNYTVWLHRLYRHHRFRTQLAPYNGSMGYGVPAAIAAKATHPERVVVSWNGDGCFQMNGQELASASPNKDGGADTVVSAPAAHLLDVEHLSVEFRSTERVVAAVRDVSFYVGRGETVAIVGESGSGKSVTALSLMRLVEHGGGTITAGRMDFARDNVTRIDLARASAQTM